jgi:hypothetical protein
MASGVPGTREDLVGSAAEEGEDASMNPLDSSLPASTAPALAAVGGVEVLGRYVVELTFGSGEVKILDLEPMMWEPLFVPLLSDYDLFCQVRADPGAGAITWPNGASWAADELYVQSKPKSPRDS